MKYEENAGSVPVFPPWLRGDQCPGQLRNWQGIKADQVDRIAQGLLADLI